jgi:hypothetical protein
VQNLILLAKISYYICNKKKTKRLIKVLQQLRLGVFATLLAALLLVNNVVMASNTLSVLYSSGSNSFTVQVTAADDVAERIMVMSLIGRKLKEQQYVRGQDKYTFTDMSDFPSGIYLIVLKDKNGKIIDTAKLVINKQ